MNAPRGYSAGAVFRRLARAAGIVVIFSVVGPLALAALISLLAVAFGATLLQMLLVLVELEVVRTMISVAVWLLAIATVIASLLPSVATGLIFALAAVYAEINMIWIAWIAAAIAIAGFVVFGMFVAPPETSAVILLDVKSLRQALMLSAMLGVVAIAPVSLCWWLAKPLHRASIAA